VDCPIVSGERTRVQVAAVHRTAMAIEVNRLYLNGGKRSACPTIIKNRRAAAVVGQALRLPQPQSDESTRPQDNANQTA
jgi:hypothetical protein